MNNLLIYDEAQWDWLIAKLGSAVLIAKPEGTDPKDARPLSFPCLAKVAKAAMAAEKDDQVEHFEIFVIMLFYKEDARVLLGLEPTTDVEGYKYAEAV